MKELVFRLFTGLGVFGVLMRLAYLSKHQQNVHEMVFISTIGLMFFYMFYEVARWE